MVSPGALPARRALLALAAAGGVLGLSACAGALQALAPQAAAPPTFAGGGLVSRWRSVGGGFLGAAVGPLGLPALPGSGPYVKLLAPTAIALRGHELLVVDSGAGHIYRVDLGFETLVPVAGAPATPGTLVALGPDHSAWVLDRRAAQVLRIGRDGRLLQTFAAAGPATAGLALVDGGLTLLLADATLGRLFETRGAGGVAVTLTPQFAGGRRLASVSGLAVGRDVLYVLDGQEGRVHLLRRDGQVLASLGGGELKRPQSMAADDWGRVFVVDAHDRLLKVFAFGQPMQTLDAAQLGVMQIDAVAVDQGVLAVADSLTGRVALLHVRPGERGP